MGVIGYDRGRRRKRIDAAVAQRFRAAAGVLRDRGHDEPAEGTRFDAFGSKNLSQGRGVRFYEEHQARLALRISGAFDQRGTQRNAVDTGFQGRPTRYGVAVKAEFPAGQMDRQIAAVVRGQVDRYVQITFPGSLPGSTVPGVRRRSSVYVRLGMKRIYMLDMGYRTFRGTSCTGVLYGPRIEGALRRVLEEERRCGTRV